MLHGNQNRCVSLQRSRLKITELENDHLNKPESDILRIKWKVLCKKNLWKKILTSYRFHFLVNQFQTHPNVWLHLSQFIFQQLPAITFKCIISCLLLSLVNADKVNKCIFCQNLRSILISTSFAESYWSLLSIILIRSFSVVMFCIMSLSPLTNIVSQIFIC